jgi:hypothetical protein
VTTVGDQRHASGKITGPRADLAQRKVHGSGKVTSSELGRFSNVDDHGSGPDRLPGLFRVDLLNG